MRKKLLILFFQISCAAGFSESLPLVQMGTPFRSPHLDIRWNAPSNALPATLWVYQKTSAKLSSSAISNLMVACSFTTADRVDASTNEVIFKSADQSRELTVSFAQGHIDYESSTHYGPTNLAKSVPDMARLPELTTNFLHQIGFDFSEIEKNEKGEPNFNYSEPFTVYYMDKKSITNVEWRAVGFRQAIDGFSYVGSDGGFRFGELGKVSKISLPLRAFKRYKEVRVVDVPKIISWIRNGKTVQGRLPWESAGINWNTAKSMTIERVKICYHDTAHFVYPLIALWTTVDTGSAHVEVEIDSPLVDDAK